MDDAPFGRSHRVHLHRLAVPDGVLGGQVGAPAQRLALAAPVARGIDRDPLPILPAAEGGLIGEQLDRVDGLPMPPDQQADVLTLDVGVDLLVALLHCNRGLQAEVLDDPLEQDPHPLGGRFGQHRSGGLSSVSHAGSLGANYLRRLRFRGGGGGGLVARTSSGVGTAGNGQTIRITPCWATCQTPLAMK